MMISSKGGILGRQTRRHLKAFYPLKDKFGTDCRLQTKRVCPCHIYSVCVTCNYIITFIGRFKIKLTNIWKQKSVFGFLASWTSCFQVV